MRLEPVRDVNSGILNGRINAKTELGLTYAVTYFDGEGKRRCGRCYKSNGVRAYECLATREKIGDCEYFDEKGFPKK